MIAISHRKIFYLLLLTTTILHCLHIFGRLTQLTDIFDVGVNESIPTWYLSFLLLFSSLLLAAVSVAKTQKYKHLNRWRFLSLFFLFMSIDEVAKIHKILNYLPPLNDANDALYECLSKSVLLAFTFILLHRDFTHKNTRVGRFFMSAGLILGFALCINMLSIRQLSLYGFGKIYSVLITLHHFFYMLGFVILICTFIAYIDKYMEGLKISIGDTLNIQIIFGRTKEGSKHKLVIPHRKMVIFLTYIVLGLTVASFLLHQLEFSEHNFDLITRANHIFDVDHDTSIPTWYSSVSLFFSACLLFWISLFCPSDNHFWYWRILSIIFVMLSIDEVAMIHEKIGSFIGSINLFEYISFFNYRWVLFGIPLTIIIALVYLRFILTLPIKIRCFFLVSGTLFISGAIGVEMLTAHYDSLYGYNNLTYHLLTTLEELLEMAAIVLFIHALLAYINKYMQQGKLVLFHKSFASESQIFK